jgi:hypothetical protein
MNNLFGWWKLKHGAELKSFHFERVALGAIQAKKRYQRAALPRLCDIIVLRRNVGALRELRFLDVEFIRAVVIKVESTALGIEVDCV